jgi:hypothetical protein
LASPSFLQLFLSKWPTAIGDTRTPKHPEAICPTAEVVMFFSPSINVIVSKTRHIRPIQGLCPQSRQLPSRAWISLVAF